MTTAGGPSIAGTTSRGSTQLQVTVLSVNGPLAVVIDQTGRTMQVRRDLMRAKGYQPQAGEQWIVDKYLNNAWTFALCLTPANSVDTDVTTLQGWVSNVISVYCTVRLTTAQAISATTDTFATTNWQTESDFAHMATLSTVGGTKSFITVPVAGLYLLSLRTTLASVTGASMAAFVTLGTPVSSASVARDNRASVPAGTDGTWVNPSREVYLPANSILYWGVWCSSATTLNSGAVNQPTELEVRCIVPTLA